MDEAKLHGWRLGVLVCGLFIPRVTAADSDLPSARFVIDLYADFVSETWMAAALEQNVLADVAGFARIEPVEKDRIADHCAYLDRRCRVRAYADANIDIVMLGQVSASHFKYEVYETWIGSRVGSGDIAIDGRVSLINLRQATLAVLQPFLESGGLIDKKPFLSRRHEPSQALGGVPAEKWALLLIAVLVILTAPLLLGWLLRGREPSAIQAGTQWRTLLVLLLVSGGLVGHTLDPGIWGEAFERVEPWLPIGLEQLLSILGGMAWGWFALLVFRLTLAQIPGIRHIRHVNVWPLLSVWLLVSAMRLFAVVLILGVPQAFATWGVSVFLELDRYTTLVMIAPAIGLLVYFVILSLCDQLSQYLDACVPCGEPGDQNPYHLATRKTFLGYVRRLGLDVDWRLLDRVLFLPSRGDGMTIYGGALSPVRVVIDVELLDVAIGPTQEDEAEQSDSEVPRVRRRAEPLGLVMPHDPQVKRPRRRWARRAARLRQRIAEGSEVAGIRRRRRLKPRVMGENATLLGALVPLAPNETVPLIANDQEDFSVVRQLLTEHYAAFEKGWIDDEYDDTDPTHKDFLFGAILAELGRAKRGDSLLGTIALTWQLWEPRLPGILRALASLLAQLYNWLLARYPAILNDAYVALNHGRDHLIQYLHFRLTGQTDLLTARAHPTKLLHRSRRALESIVAIPPGELPVPQRVLRDRLVWLSRYFHSPVITPRRSRLGVTLVVAVVLAGAALLANTVLEAIEYHPVYVERMQAQLEAREEGHGDQR